MATVDWAKPITLRNGGQVVMYELHTDERGRVLAFGRYYNEHSREWLPHAWSEGGYFHRYAQLPPYESPQDIVNK